MSTMSTVGYTNYFPRTHYGRVVIVSACFFGIFIVSIIMVTFNNKKKLDPAQERAYRILFRMQFRKHINSLAGLSILSFFKYASAKSKLERDRFSKRLERDLMVYEESLDRTVEHFKNSRFMLAPLEVPHEERIRVLSEKIDTQIKEVREKLCRTHKSQQTVDDIIENQKQTLSTLKQTSDKFLAIERRVADLSKSLLRGPLNVLTKTKYILDQKQLLYEE